MQNKIHPNIECQALLFRCLNCLSHGFANEALTCLVLTIIHSICVVFNIEESPYNLAIVASRANIDISLKI